MPDDTVTFLSCAKQLIRQGKRYFRPSNNEGKTYNEILLDDFGITPDVAWEIILSLHTSQRVSDDKPSYYERSDAYIFKREVNGVPAYIKLNIEERNGEAHVVCISFHQDR